MGNGDQENEIDDLQMLVRLFYGIVLSRSQVSSHLLDIYKSCWLDCGPRQRYLVKLKRQMVSGQPVTLILPDITLAGPTINCKPTRLVNI